MAEQQYETVMLRDNFYRDNYHKVTWLLLMLVGVNILLAGGVFYLVENRPQPQYFATGTDGRLIPLQALKQSLYSNSALLDWATQTAMGVYTYNFVNMEKSLKDLSPSFTTDGYRSLLAALTAAKVLDTVKTKRLISTAVPTGVPRIVDQASINGVWTWKLSLPMMISYSRGGTATQKVNVVVQMLVTRVDQASNPKGIAVSQFRSLSAA